MALSMQELEKLIYEQQTGTKLDGRLKGAKPSDSISVNITLHAEQWRQILVLKTYYSLKGSRGFNSLSSTIYMITSRVYKGLLNSLAKRAREESQEQPKPSVGVAAPGKDANPLDSIPDDDGGEDGNPGFGY